MDRTDGVEFGGDDFTPDIAVTHGKWVLGFPLSRVCRNTIQDLAEMRAGQITSWGPNVAGHGTDFTKLGVQSSIMAAGQIIPIKEIISPTSMVLKGAFPEDITERTAWKEVPFVDQHSGVSVISGGGNFLGLNTAPFKAETNGRKFRSHVRFVPPA